MKKVIFTTLFLSLALMANAAYQVTATIYDGNEGGCNYWINNGGVETEVLTEEAVVLDEGQTKPTNSKCLQMTREQTSGYDWHGIGFDLSGLNATLSAGNQIALWVKKDKSENVKLELQFADETAAIISDLMWVAPEDGWKYLVFDFSGAEAQSSVLKTMYAQLHTGGSDGEIATIQVTGIVKGFDLASPSAIEEARENLGLQVYSANGVLYVLSPSETTVYDLAGNKVAAIEAGSGSAVLAPGIYIVKNEGETIKTSVK